MDKIVSNKKFTVTASLFTIFICIIFGTNTVAIKVALSGFDVFASIVIRFFFASLTILLWAKLTKKTFSIKKGNLKKLIIISLLFVVNISCYIFGLSQTSAARATLLINTQPFFLLLLSHFFLLDDKIYLKKFFGITIAFIGVLSLFIFKEDVAGNFRHGDILVIFGAFFWAIGAVYVKKEMENFESFQLVFYPMLFSIPIFLLESVLFDVNIVKQINVTVICALLYQIFAASFGYIAWNYLLARYRASTLYSFIFIMPIAGVFTSALILKEPLTINIFIALILVVLGIIIVQAPKNNEIINKILT
jgi:drug/metabolite transporter (DMT)-like permease